MSRQATLNGISGVGEGDAFSKSKEEVINLRGGHREVLVRNEGLEMVPIWHLHMKFSKKNLKMHDKISFWKSERLIQREKSTLLKRLSYTGSLQQSTLSKGAE